VERGSTSSRAEPDDPTDRGVTVTVGLLDGDEGFYVEDDGSGIDESNRDEVFEPGFSTATEGTGLGLGIVRTIAHAHGWSVSLADCDGGARFEVRTDRADEPTAQSASEGDV
jgi:signal transduction histidine kinase